MKEAEVVVALVTGPDRASLEALGRTLVEDRLIACANIIGGVTSIFRWDGAVETSDECLAILKTTRPRVAALEKRVASLHPYAVPEFLVLAVGSGAAPYLDWVRSAVGEE
jgi:periplasmic divalent cation tolerance protein